MKRNGDIRDWKPIDFVKVGGGLFLVSGVIAFLTLAVHRSAVIHESWQETPCRIVSAQARQPSSDDRPDKVRVFATYRYEIDGEMHEARGEGLPRVVDPDWRYFEVNEFLEGGGADDTDDVCLVDPEDPASSIFRAQGRESTLTMFRIALSAAVFFLAFLGYGLVRGMTKGFR